MDCLIVAIGMSKIKDRISGVLSNLFPDRQIMLRSEGRVSFVTLSKRFQLCAEYCGKRLLRVYGTTPPCPKGGSKAKFD